MRLHGYDYSLPGAYFVTICVQNRECLFGEIKNREMILNEYGKIADAEWRNSSQIRKEIILDEFIIMPNHIHGIIYITNLFHQNVGATGGSPEIKLRSPEINTTRAMVSKSRATSRSPLQNQYVRDQYTKSCEPRSKSIGAFVGGFKSKTTKQINQLRLMYGVPVWQRNYWERIIRNKIELNKIRQYIKNNPIKWQGDNYYV